MNLPVDRRRTAAEAARLDAIEFVPPPGSSEAALSAAFAALLFRYGGAGDFELEAGRVSPGGDVLWRATAPLGLSPETPGRELVKKLEDLLAGGAAVKGALEVFGPPGPDGARALGLRLAEGAAPRLVYDSSQFKAATASRAAGHLGRLAWCLVSEPSLRLDRAPLLTEEEQAAMARDLDGKPRAPAPELFHRAFEARAAESPGRTAARHRDASLTYGELNARANALAERLARAGAGPESRVAVCLEPSLHAPAALLAVLKAGAVYVPLDPSHPEARLRALIADLKPAAVITRAGLVEKLQPGSAPVLAVDDFEDLVAGCGTRDVERSVTPEQTAYIFFTSGTTGAPKGAMASQANLAAYVASARERYGLCEDDVVPVIARFSFSISLFELAAPLASGAMLVILDRDHVVDPARMTETLKGVTLFHAGPSLLKALTAYLKSRGSDFSAFDGVRHASSGGDMVAPELLESLKLVFRKAEVFVIYGCSEIACLGTTYPVPRHAPVERTFVGRPFDGVSVRVCDAGLNVVPAGVVGEICFSGDGVVKGYLDRPDLTAQKFVMLDGRRFYRTGDMGRVSEDGWLEILGRSDFQVKVRGIRVELGEIEHHLRRASGVRDAVVMPMPLGRDEKALVAYVVLDGQADEAALREHMARHLPEYMMPAAYVRLDALPLNHNMKVDRRALPPPERAARRAPAAEGREPRTPTQLALAELFGRLLGLESVSLDARFFDLGGHSLLGLQLIVEAGRELGAELQGLELVRETLEGLAAIIDRRLGRETGACVPAAAAEPDFTPFYFGEGAELYGVLSGPAKTDGAAVLICPPLGHEQARAQFVLRRLAERLAARGVPSLRFDFYGCGESLGQSRDAGPARWRRDVAAAAAELGRRTGAARVTALGARLSAGVLAAAAPGLGLSRLVLWDPVRDCARHLPRLAEAHRRFVGAWRRLYRPPSPLEGARELLGLTLSDQAWAELKGLAFPPEEGVLPAVSILDSRDAGHEPGWLDIVRVGEIMPDRGLSAALERLVLEEP